MKKILSIVGLLGLVSVSAFAADQYSCDIQNDTHSQTDPFGPTSKIYNATLTVDVTKVSDVMAGKGWKKSTVILDNGRLIEATITLNDGTEYGQPNEVTLDLRAFENGKKDGEDKDFVVAVGGHVTGLTPYIRASEQTINRTTLVYDTFDITCKKL